MNKLELNVKIRKHLNEISEVFPRKRDDCIFFALWSTDKDNVEVVYSGELGKLEEALFSFAAINPSFAEALRRVGSTLSQMELEKLRKKSFFEILLIEANRYNSAHHTCWRYRIQRFIEDLLQRSLFVD